jgi:hypothetical protein
MKNPKVLFLDIDGPMIPRRQWIKSRIVIPTHHNEFDAIATAMVRCIINITKSSIVISSAWKAYAVPAFAENGFDPMWFHEDIFTPKQPEFTRTDEVQGWLDRHPEVTHWAAFDDLPTPQPGGILVDFDNGISMAQFYQALKLLGT